jgi:iron complex outermembrane receptor protein
LEHGEVDNPAISDLYFRLNTATWQATWNLKEKRGWQHTLGASGMFQQNHNLGQEVLIPEYALRDAGVYFHTQHTAGKLTVSGGLRLDNRHLDSKFLEENNQVRFAAFTRDFTNLAGSLGLSYRPSKQVTWKLNLARGFRAPSIPELASNGAHEGSKRYEYGNKDLGSETSLQLDGSLDWNTDHFSLEATVFYNSIGNYIFYRKLLSSAGGDSLVTTDNRTLPAYQYDQRKAALYGAELTFDIHPHPFDWLHFENTFSYVHARFAEALDGTRNIPYIPAARLLSELRADLMEKGKTIRNLSLTVEMDANFAQNAAFTGFETETSTPGYTLFNAGLSTDIVSKGRTLMRIYVNALNLGDVAYQSHLSRLKYTDENVVTGRRGVFAMGRNFSFKVNIPLSWDLKR